MRLYAIITVLMILSVEAFSQTPLDRRGRPAATTAEELVRRDDTDFFARCERNPSSSVLNGTDNTGVADGGAVRGDTGRGQQ